MLESLPKPILMKFLNPAIPHRAILKLSEPCHCARLGGRHYMEVKNMDGKHLLLKCLCHRWLRSDCLLLKVLR